MHYHKPKDMTYTEMCMYVDQHAYDENKSNEVKENIYKYIYCITHMLAIKLKLFNDYKYYDDFSLWYTTQIFYRLENPKQYELDNFGNPKMTKIKSILNYIKSTISVRKISFEQQEYSQVINYTDDYYVDYNYSLSDKINNNLDDLYKVEFDLCLDNCCKSIKQFLIKRLPYKKNSVEFYNIYFSCLLTFLNSITIPNKDINRINNLKYKENIDLTQIFIRESADPVILYHLDDTFHDYILVLYRQIRHEIGSEIQYSSNSYIGTNESLYNLMVNELNGYEHTDYGE